MNPKTPSSSGGHDVLRRLNAIGARIESVSRRAGALLRESEEKGKKVLPEGDPLRHLEEIESNLAQLEERLKKVEIEMRDNESPPHSFGTSSEFSTGPHLPGLG
jgi:hypothetical protein